MGGIGLSVIGFSVVFGFGVVIVHGTLTVPEAGLFEGSFFLFGCFCCLFLAPIVAALGVGLGLLIPWAIEREHEYYGRGKDRQ